MEDDIDVVPVEEVTAEPEPETLSLECLDNGVLHVRIITPEGKYHRFCVTPDDMVSENSHPWDKITPEQAATISLAAWDWQTPERCELYAAQLKAASENELLF